VEIRPIRQSDQLGDVLAVVLRSAVDPSGRPYRALVSRTIDELADAADGAANRSRGRTAPASSRRPPDVAVETVDFLERRGYRVVEKSDATQPHFAIVIFSRWLGAAR